MTVNIFVRHCKGNKKLRPDWFSYEKCFQNLLSVIDKDTKLTVVFHGDPSDHFISKYPNVNIVTSTAECESQAFTELLDYVLSLDLTDDEIIYILEDDYMHVPGAMDILREGFQTNADYVTLYDHADKYMNGYYDVYAKGFPIQITHTQSVHWRTTPSTTNTYAMKFKTLKNDKEIHYKYCNKNIVGKGTCDHNKFIELWNFGRSLISCIPGYSTHCEPGLLSPVINWERITDTSESPKSTTPVPE